MADTYVKLDSVLGLIERVKALYKENPNEHPINYGTMVGLEVGINTGQLFTEQDIIKPYLERLKRRMEARDDDNGGEPLNAVDRGYHLAYEHLCEEIDNILSENEEEE